MYAMFLNLILSSNPTQSREMGNVFSKIKELNDKDAVELYQQKISAM